MTNVGEIRNSGFELALEYNAKFNDNFTWIPAINLATFKNTLEALEFEELERAGALGAPGLNDAMPILIEPGRSIGDISVPVFNGINSDGTWNVTDDREEFVVVGNGLPDVNINFVNTFQYKNWDLNFLLRGVFGHQLVNATRVFYEQPNVAPTFNVLSSSTRSELQGLSVAESRLSSFYVENGDFLRMDNITLGYNLSRSVRR